MIKVEVSKTAIKEIENKLDTLKVKSPDILKKAINDTAKQARKELSVEAKKTYVMKVSSFNKSMKIKTATNKRLEAIISATGKVTELKDFKVSPAKYQQGVRVDILKGKGLKSSSMKKLQKGNLKAFLAKFKSGHVSVVQRVPGKKMKSNPKKEFIKKFLSPSIPKMLGNEKEVFGKVEPNIYSNLQRNLENHISQIIGGK